MSDILIITLFTIWIFPLTGLYIIGKVGRIIDNQIDIRRFGKVPKNQDDQSFAVRYNLGALWLSSLLAFMATIPSLSDTDQLESGQLIRTVAQTPLFYLLLLGIFVGIRLLVLIVRYLYKKHRAAHPLALKPAIITVAQKLGFVISPDGSVATKGDLVLKPAPFEVLLLQKPHRLQHAFELTLHDPKKLAEEVGEILGEKIRTLGIPILIDKEYIMFQISKGRRRLRRDLTNKEKLERHFQEMKEILEELKDMPLD